MFANLLVSIGLATNVEPGVGGTYYYTLMYLLLISLFSVSRDHC